MTSSLSTVSPALFDPARLGTPEPLWQEALDEAPCLPLPDCSLLVVSPHPDDEVLGAGGVMRRAHQARRSVHILSVTDGEAAYPDWQDLGRVRRREGSDALRVLGSDIASHRLGIPDGRVSRHRAELFDAIDRRLTANTLLLAPYELDGHPDHDATGEVCCEIARKRHVPLWRYPIWTWHHATPEQFAGRFSRFMLDAAGRNAKARAMSCFASQLRPLGRAPIVPGHVLAYFCRPYEVFLV